MAKGGASFRRDRAFLAREAERSASTRPESVVCSRRYELGLGPAYIPCIFYYLTHRTHTSGRPRRPRTAGRLPSASAPSPSPWSCARWPHG